MNKQVTERLLNDHGLKLEDFLDWMFGQTTGIVDGEPDYYEWDVSMYINMKSK